MKIVLDYRLKKYLNKEEYTSLNELEEDMLATFDDYQYEINHKDEEIEELRNRLYHPEEYQEDRYEDYRIGELV